MCACDRPLADEYGVAHWCWSRVPDWSRGDLGRICMLFATRVAHEWGLQNMMQISLQRHKFFKQTIIDCLQCHIAGLKHHANC